MNSVNSLKLQTKIENILTFPVVCIRPQLTHGWASYDFESGCTFNNEHFNVGTVASFTCQSGYRVDGSSQATCVRGGNTGYWSNGTPRCSNKTLMFYLFKNKIQVIISKGKIIIKIFCFAR